MHENEVIPVWKPVGASTHVISKKIAEKLGVLTSHTGTLDPMAQGIIVVLAGETRHKKYEYAKWEKTYEFEMVFGIETDTFDALGFTTNEIEKNVDKVRLEKTLENFLGKYAQKVPPYSAIKVKGKPLHWYARNAKLDQVKLPQRKGNILKIDLISLEETALEKVLENTCKKIETVGGDLRQKEIILNWKNFLKNHKNQKVQIAKIKVETTKGIYIRRLSQDVAEKLDTCAFVYSLTRTKNGPFDEKSNFYSEVV